MYSLQLFSSIKLQPVLREKLDKVFHLWLDTPLDNDDPSRLVGCHLSDRAALTFIPELNRVALCLSLSLSSFGSLSQPLT